MTWLDWLINGRRAHNGLKARIVVLEGHMRAMQHEQRQTHDAVVAIQKSPVQLREVEKALAEQQALHAEDMRELRERLDLPQRRKPSGRPFSVLQKVAELGERMQAQKNSV